MNIKALSTLLFSKQVTFQTCAILREEDLIIMPDLNSYFLCSFL